MPIDSSILSPRELQILTLIAKDNTKFNSDIARELGISRRTVEKHVEHILAKLHVETRYAAAKLLAP